MAMRGRGGVRYVGPRVGVGGEGLDGGYVRTMGVDGRSSFCKTIVPPECGLKMVRAKIEIGSTIVDPSKN